MKPDKKAKWIVGITGTALSAFILSQLDTNSTSDANTQVSQQEVAYQSETSVENPTKLTEREQELANKDWTNFTIEDKPAEDSVGSQSMIQQQPVNPPTDRNTSRS